ncbi:hypothetical protein LINPERPRIM_LOCUS1369 [Linum perenne]
MPPRQALILDPSLLPPVPFADEDLESRRRYWRVHNLRATKHSAIDKEDLSVHIVIV